MLKTLNLKKGFTFIELLIVMSIIAILVVLSVSGYTAFRKAALIDLSADSLIAQINEMKDKAIHGTKFGVVEPIVPVAPVEGEEVASPEDFLKCYGLSVKKNVDDVYEMTAAVYKFIGKKVWSDLEGKWVYQGCGETPLEDGILEMDSMVKVEEIKMSEDEGVTFTDVEDFVFRFAPPDGNLEVLGGGGEFENKKGLIEIKIRYGSGDDDRYSRVVEIDLGTGKAKKI